MTDSARQKILGACYKFLLPIARVLLANGIGYREFDEACRQAFVKAASTEFGVRGRETNISRVATMTGIPRKQVQDIKKLMTFDGVEPRTVLSPLADLLHVWATADEYKDSSGRALALEMNQENGRSFGKLVRTCMGDVPSGAVKTELLRLGVITISSDDKLLLNRRSLIPDDIDRRLESAIVYSLRGLADTIAHNNDPRIDNSARFFERFVESRPLSESEVSHVRTAVRTRLIQVSEELDFLVNAGPISEISPQDRRVGIGLFYTE